VIGRRACCLMELALEMGDIVVIVFDNDSISCIMIMIMMIVISTYVITIATGHLDINKQLLIIVNLPL
jgi:hypothetical protein